MDIIPIAVSVLSGSTVGALGMTLFVGGRVQRFRHTIAARDKTIDAHASRIRDAEAERDRQTDRCVKLRQAVRKNDQSLDVLARKLAEIEPDATLGRKHREQRDRALAAANAANRARSSAKHGSNVASLPKRKRA
jgi:hypothetical protein